MLWFLPCRIQVFLSETHLMKQVQEITFFHLCRELTNTDLKIPTMIAVTHSLQHNFITYAQDSLMCSN